MFDQETQSVSPRHAYIIGGIIVAALLCNSLLKFVNIVSNDQLFKMIQMMLILGSVVVFLFTFMNFNLSLLGFIFVAPLATYNMPYLKFFFTYADAYLIILVIILAGRTVIGHSPRRKAKTFLDRLIFVFIIFSLLSIVNSNNISAAFRELIQTIEYFVFCYYLFVLVVTRRNILNSVIHALVVISILISVHGIMQYLKMGGGETRILGTFGHFNATGTYLAMMITFTFNLVIAEKNRRTRLVFYAALMLNTIAIIMTFSRGAWIGTILGIVLSAQIRGMVQFIRAFGVVVVVLVIMAIAAPPRYIGRLASVPMIADEASKSRLRQYQIAFETITSYPLLGVGLVNNGYHVTRKYNEPENGEIHNMFLHIGSERGLPAMITLFAIFGYFFVHITRRIGQTEDPFFHSFYIALFAVMVAFGMVNLFAYQLIRGLGLFFAMFMALYSAGMYIEENEPVESEWVEMLSTVDMKRHHLDMGM